jgi:subtilisin family serine protease
VGGYWPPPDDFEGHGTHAASIAAGRAVRNASLYGLADGVARGGAPGARLAVYKVCWGGLCNGEDVLAGMDDAVADGVDIISVSLAMAHAHEYVDDSLAVGAFHALRRGVVTSVAAGANCGRTLGTVSNVAPWMIAAAATNSDRKIFSKVVLGNGKHFLVRTSIVLGISHLLIDEQHLPLT